MVQISIAAMLWRWSVGYFEASARNICDEVGLRVEPAGRAFDGRAWEQSRSEGGYLFLTVIAKG
jgi:hypothetical protein